MPEKIKIVLIAFVGFAVAMILGGLAGGIVRKGVFHGLDQHTLHEGQIKYGVVK